MSFTAFRGMKPFSRLLFSAFIVLGVFLVFQIAATLVAIPVFGFQQVTGLLAGLAGIVLSSRVMSGSPAMGQGYELDAIASVVIGGTKLTGGVGTIAGTVLGALIIGVMNNGLDLLNVSSYWQQIVKGLIILLAVMIDRKK